MSRFAIYQWIKEQAIKPSSADEALVIAGERSTPHAWHVFLRRLLWTLGSMAMVASLIFFLAYNWQAMGAVFKFLMVQAALLLMAVLYWLWSGPIANRYQLNHSTLVFGQTVIRVTIALLVGGLLALFGQVYQTGADPWQLFAIWVLLIAPMVVGSGQAVLWILWSVLINLALALYVDTRPQWLAVIGGGDQAIALFLAVNLGLWFMLILLSNNRHYSSRILAACQLSQPWAQHLQAIVVLFCLLVMGMMTIIDRNSGWGFGIMTLLGLAGFFFWYRRIRLDLMMLAFWLLTVMTLVVTVVIKVVDGWLSGYLTFWIALLILGMTTVSVKWLKSLRRSENPSLND